jgi:hypothetical protein
VIIDVSRESLLEVFPENSIIRFRPDALGAAVRHEETVRFASTVGVPHSSGLFRALSAFAEPSPDYPRKAVVPGGADRWAPSPDGDLLQIGWLLGAWLLVHPGSGAVYASPGDEVECEHIHRDLSSLCYTLYRIAKERPARDDRDPYAFPDAAERIEEAVSAVDPTPFAHEEGIWQEFLDSFASGMY